ncbi:Disease resistance protein RGA2 [Hordeum vulgare]|nr:Disease resistance protein RGA2 [Hordeum vulgare]
MLSSLQTLPVIFNVSNEQGYELKQLRDLNKLRGKLGIGGLENVKSKGQALQANLAAKKLTELTLGCRKVKADVLEGLCPSAGLKKLELWHFVGWRYPDWMVGKQTGGPKDLQELCLSCCSQPTHASGLAEAFPHLRVLNLYYCKWDALPGHMEHLTSLKELLMHGCYNIRSLPSLPQSLEEFVLTNGNKKFVKSCETVGHPNWEKIKDIPYKSIISMFEQAEKT